MNAYWLVAIAAAYLIGSIPFGVLIGRARGINIREHGSRNIGATNVSRVLGRPLGITCFVLDMLKGTVPVAGAGIFFGVFGRDVLPSDGANTAAITSLEMILWLAVAGASICGHMFSMFLRFGGGKGVATGFGAVLAMWNLLTFPAIFAVVVWYTTLRMTRYVSLSSILAAASLPLWCIIYFTPPRIETQPFSKSFGEWLTPWPLYAATILLGLLVVWRHRANLGRIRRGEEPKVGGRKRRGDLLNQDESETRNG